MTSINDYDSYHQQFSFGVFKNFAGFLFLFGVCMYMLDIKI